MSGYCFVIQPFDADKFDRRYAEIFAPAIREAGLEPYRVDEDPGASIPIEQIEKRIQNASACLADITLDNPNVWFELGYALAANKEICLVCANERTKYPFDVQHRSIIRYRADSPSDFDSLKQQISKRLVAVQESTEKLAAITSRSPIKGEAGLSQHEIIVLATAMENRDGPFGGVSHWTMKNALERQGFNNLGLNIGIERLREKQMLKATEKNDQDGDPYTVYEIEPAGTRWLFDNIDKLDLTISKKVKNRKTSESDLDDAIPF